MRYKTIFYNFGTFFFENTYRIHRCDLNGQGAGHDNFINDKKSSFLDLCGVKKRL